MKASKLSAFLFVASLLLPVALLAGSMNKKSLHLFETVTVHGKTLSPGDYRVEWNGSGPNVKLDIVQGRDTLVTVSAKIVTESIKSEQDGYTLDKDHGNQELVSIFFSGTDYRLQIPESGSASASRSTSGS
ncbi:MAG TPA: hypothetical protein VE077_09340 [Candidatus Methylomirabilis sp.]|nr:hypothetical protein [Candidatus Methylomirabilis sp.]